MSKNFNGKIYLIIGAIFAVGFFFLPFVVKAATTVYFDLENPVIYEGDTFLANLKISTPDKSINVIDGTVIYDSKKLEIREISAGGSLLALWPKPPVFSNEKGSLSFVGGVSGGFQGEKGEVLKIIFLAKSEGEAKIDFLDGFSVFLNDGQGTSINPWLRPLSLNILKRPVEIPPKDEWQILVQSDKNPPESFEITLGKESSIFNGQYFINFFTTDKESGIDHYEIQEGTEPYVVGDSPYLLKDQILQGIIKVKAIDKAGNERVVKLTPTYPPRHFYQTVWFWLALILAIILVLILIRAIKSILKKKNV
ncbi:MAG: cohesin domain-containing protein [Candidatus Azambacteria bacterium]|nr:cohesin domain-containing protein [Candidatus Azambacteria bacterium]